MINATCLPDKIWQPPNFVRSSIVVARSGNSNAACSNNAPFRRFPLCLPKKFICLRNTACSGTKSSPVDNDW
ncbi:unnamed protein product [Lasius platythorax]|uniref:Uncharacterized protein n=1 Tax=Lasius platythorax TaxID=488582 RepID=A0AAV2NV69_9HYME